MYGAAKHAVGGDAGCGLLLHAKNACIPHTPYTLVLEFVPSAGRVCGAATHAVGGDAGYGLLFNMCHLSKM